MKKLLALILLLVHFFNLAGYTFLFGYLGQQSTEHITRQIEQHQYDDAELVEIRIPLNLPYITSWGSYERIDGEITINGSHHNYVKRKVSGDTLYLLCLPNRDKDELQVAKSNFGTDANDLGGKQETQQVKKGAMFTQYQIQDADYAIASRMVDGLMIYPLITSSLTDSFIDKHGRPPRS